MGITRMENTLAPVAIELRVRYAETDQMGVVYHANYLAWCEVARTELIRRRARSYADLEREGIRLAVSEATLRYHAPARYDDLIRVECWTEEVRSRAVTFGYLVSRLPEGGEPERLVSARTALVAIDHAGRPRKLPAELIGRLRGE
jgi:acyl-CoA thioester hydrolase